MPGWLKTMCRCVLLVMCSVEDFLGLLVKLVHYNSAYLEEDILSQLIYCTCSLANQSTVAKETEVAGQVQWV